MSDLGDVTIKLTCQRDWRYNSPNSLSQIYVYDADVYELNMT